MRKNLKSLLCLVMAALMCLSLIACGGTTEETPAPQQNTPVQNSPVTGGSDASGSEQTTPPAGPATDFLADAEGLPETLANPNISIVYWYNEDQYAYDTSKNANVYDPILEAIPYFEEKYGGEVNVIYAAWGDMLNTVTALQQSGEAPDLFEVYDETMYSVVLSGVAQPLDAYVSDADYGYYDVSRDLFSWDGASYAIPLKPYAFYIMFNKDLFDLEGLPYPDELYREGKWNWSTFRDVCKQLTKTVDGEVTQVGYGSWEDTILSFMYADGCTLLNTDTATGEVSHNLDDPKVQNTLNYLIELKDTFVYGNDMWGWFDNGAMAMIRGHEFPVDFPFEVGMVPFPSGDDYEGKNLVVYPQAMAVPTGAANPEGAVAFMRIVNELQLEVGNQKEANRIGQENYDLIYSEDVRMVYAYDKCLNDIGTVVATIVNYIREGVPAATISANVAPVIQAEIDLMYGE